MFQILILQQEFLRIIQILEDGSIGNIISNAGSIDYEKGEVNVSTVNFLSTEKPNNNY